MPQTTLECEIISHFLNLAGKNCEAACACRHTLQKTTRKI